MKPLFKYVGGKTRLLLDLYAALPCKPDAFDRLIEPFAGGAAMFFALEPKRAVLADANADLTVVYRAIRDDVERVIRRLRTHERDHNRRHYYALRARFNVHRRTWHESWRASAFLYFNRTCFNGLWRVNKDGDFNVPIGDYKDPKILDRATLRAGAELLQRASIHHQSFAVTINDTGDGDLIYADPPYDPMTVTANFTNYTDGRFTRDDQRALAHTLLAARKRGAHVMVSNSDTPFVWGLYPKRDGWRHVRVRRRGTISSNKHKRGSVGELIIVGPASGASV